MTSPLALSITCSLHCAKHLSSLHVISPMGLASPRVWGGASPIGLIYFQSRCKGSPLRYLPRLTPREVIMSGL